MTKSFLENVLRGAEALAARDPVGTLPDQELLRRFESDRDAAAFAVLVHRHGPLVWGVCRNMLPADADADDAFQATFLALVRSAKTVRNPKALAGWLHGVAYRVAMKARRTTARRKKGEVSAAAPEAGSPVSENTWDELQAAVHEEVCRLPEKLRLPFVLCGLQGRPQKDAAKQLDWTIGTFSGRLSQARQRLIDRLGKRGVPVGVAAGAAVLGVTSSGGAVPSAIAMKVLAATSAPEAVSPVVISLARGVTSMYMTRTKLLIAGVLLAGILTAGIGARILSSADAQTPDLLEQAEEQLAIERALEQLRALEAAEDRFEYKFVPAEKAMTADNLQKLLSAHDHEGWNHCGSQNLAVGGKAIPHLTFKRPRPTRTSRNDALNYDTTAALLAAIAAAQKENPKGTSAKFVETILREYKEGQAKSTAEHQKLIEALRLYEQAFLAQTDPAAKKQAEAAKQAAARLRALDAVLREKDAAAARAAAAEQEHLRAEKLVEELRKAIEEREALLRKLREAEKEKPVPPGKSPEQASIMIALKYIGASEAIKTLEKLAPDVKVTSVDARTNSLIIRTAPESAKKIQEIFAKMIDVEVAKTSASANSIDIAVVSLKRSKGAAVLPLLGKVGLKNVKVALTKSEDSIIIAGPAGDVAAARKVIEELDAAGGRKK